MDDDERPEIIEGNGTSLPVSNVVGYVEHLGINAVTTYDCNPYFFLFADIDSKEIEQLREILKVYRENNLSVYFYETEKGWHALSPVLLNLRRWARLCDKLRPLMDYSFDTLRFQKRARDGTILFFEDWNHKNLESYNLHYELTNRFMVGMKSIKPNYVTTKLNWCKYMQLRIKNIRHL